jgi:hypothetical protein
MPKCHDLSATSCLHHAAATASVPTLVEQGSLKRGILAALIGRFAAIVNGAQTAEKARSKGLGWSHKFRHCVLMTNSTQHGPVGLLQCNR